MCLALIICVVRGYGTGVGERVLFNAMAPVVVGAGSLKPLARALAGLALALV